MIRANWLTQAVQGSDGPMFTNSSSPCEDYCNLQKAERALIDELRSEAKKAKDWSSFSNSWMSKVSEFYSQLGLTRPQIRQTAGYRVGQDLDSRMAIAKGLARAPDYRDELESLIGERFQTRRAFCECHWSHGRHAEPCAVQAKTSGDQHPRRIAAPNRIHVAYFSAR